MQALSFKVLANNISDDASDHYPVMADLKFN
jgi:endonuclease/exonuclease/phosphatase family metal-dependent hydrolase